MKRATIAFVVCLVLSLGAVVAVLAGHDSPWVGAEQAVALTQGQNLRPNTYLALYGDKRAVIWTGQTSPKGVFLAQWEEVAWNTTTLADTGEDDAWFPSLAYSGTRLLATWVQGVYNPPEPWSAPLGDIVQQDVGTGATAKTVITQVHSYTAPYIAVGPTGMHLTFAAARPDNPQDWNKLDLYYVHRPLTQTAWETPTIVVTRTQVVPQASTGAVEYPRIALSADGATLHIVWEQREQGARSVWHMAGTWSLDGPQWAAPTQISPLGQDYAVRPNVAVDDAGGVHVVWSELITGTGSIPDPEAQYINYRRFDGSEWSSPLRLNLAPIQVSNNFPTWASSSIDVQGDSLCVAWHGYYAAADKEESSLRCSQDRGQSWLPVLNGSESAALLSIFPTVRLDQWGQVHLVWGEFQLDRSSYGLYYRTGQAEVSQVFMPVVLRGP